MCCPWEERRVRQHSSFLLHPCLRPVAHRCHLRKQHQPLWLPLRAVYRSVSCCRAAENSQHVLPQTQPTHSFTNSTITPPSTPSCPSVLPVFYGELYPQCPPLVRNVWKSDRVFVAILPFLLMMCFPHKPPFALTASSQPFPFLPTCLAWMVSAGNQVSLY